MNILELIKKEYNNLTRKQKEISDFLLEKPASICYISLAELSEKVNCSEITILRFCKRLGFNSFIDLKNEFRKLNKEFVEKYSSSSYSVPFNITDEDSKTKFLMNFCNDELRKFSKFYEDIDFSIINRISNLVMERDIIYIFAHDASKVVGSSLEKRLKVLNFNIVTVDLENMRKTEYVLKQIKSNDLTIFMSFPNYYYSIDSISENISDKDCDIVLFTDSILCPVSKYTENIIICDTETEIFHNSWLLPIAAVNILTANLAMLIESKK